MFRGLRLRGCLGFPFFVKVCCYLLSKQAPPPSFGAHWRPRTMSQDSKPLSPHLILHSSPSTPRSAPQTGPLGASHAHTCPRCSTEELPSLGFRVPDTSTTQNPPSQPRIQLRKTSKLQHMRRTLAYDVLTKLFESPKDTCYIPDPPTNSQTELSKTVACTGGNVLLLTSRILLMLVHQKHLNKLVKLCKVEL